MRKSLSSCKKGNSALEVMFVIVFLMLLAITTVMIYPAVQDINADIQSDPELAPEGKSIAADLNTRYPNTMDDLFVIIFALLWVGVLIAAFYIDAHPIFFGAGLMLLVVLLIVGGIMNNVYADVMNDASMIGQAENFPKITFMMENLISLILAISMSILVALYGKTRIG